MLEQVINFIIDFVEGAGYIGIFIMMTLESSFFPFPSEVAMVPAGILSSEGKMNFLFALIAGILGSLTGALLNYFIGKCLGKKFILSYGKYVFFTENHYNKTEKYFLDHGSITTFVGRFIPAVRQYISFPAGVVSMNIPKFLFFTGLGAGLWSLTLMIIGYIAGENKELISEYKMFAIIGILIIILFVVAAYLFYNKRTNRLEA